MTRIASHSQNQLCEENLSSSPPCWSWRLWSVGPFIIAHIPITTSSAGAAAARGQTSPVPVVEGVVATKDVPIYLDGLGTVQAFNTVTVHTRVDGQVVKVAFTEGQDVQAGDVLAQIDPAPYQAALDQAVAKKGAG